MYEICTFVIYHNEKKKKMKFNIVSILLMYNCLMFIVDNMFNSLKFVQVLNMFKLLKMFIEFSMLSVFKNIDSVEIYENDVILAMFGL